jgi:deoxyribodipyrimidine photo-lyase
MKKLTVFWFRRDLRLNDNKGLYEALIGRNKVLPVFIFDTDITSKLNKDDARLTFIYNALVGINNIMRGNRCRVGLYRGTPKDVIKKIIRSEAKD